MKTKTITGALLSAILLSSGSAFALTVDSADSSAYDYSFNLMGPQYGLALTGDTVSAGIAPAAYDYPLATTNGGLAYGGSVQGVNVTEQSATTNASSNVDGTAGSKTTSASSLVNNFAYYSYFIGYKVELNIDAIGSTSTVSGTPGSFNANSSLTLSNLVLTVNNVVLLDQPGPVAANTFYDWNTILPGSGVTMYLNQQTESCTGTGCSIATDALHIILKNSPVLGPPVGPVTGDIILGYSQAEMVGAVPEPETWAMLLAGLGLVGMRIHRRA